MTVYDLPVVRASDVRRVVSTGLAWLLYAVGWTVAKAYRGLVTVLAAVLFGVGWLAGKVLWPALIWSATAVRLGWDEGRKPMGGQRGTA